MKVSKQGRRDAKSLLAACRVNGVLDEAKVRQALTVVLQQKPRGYVGLLSYFQRLVRLDIAKRTAVVESAVALPPALQQSIQQNLLSKYGAGIQAAFSTNPALIGGVRIRVGSDVYDGSIQAKLNNLADQF
ncbi:MAG: F0F1 ATP synthase subunit delta [Verrucomicrobia bacterium]|nr:F0F1 ATP synthase subunit delta [Verrucomicrobiota bacterium]